MIKLSVIKFSSLIFLLFSGTKSFAQTDKSFSRKYSYISIYYFETKKWTEWKKNDNTFIINYNSSGDILHIMETGERFTLRKIGPIERASTDEGDGYQIMKMVNNHGSMVEFQIFDDDKNGLKLIYRTAIMQFANKD